MWWNTNIQNYINWLYSDIFILGCILKVSMFINLCWKKDNKTLKACFPINKLGLMMQKLEKQGIQTWFEMPAF